MTAPGQGVFDRIASAIRRALEAIAPSAETIAQRNALALQGACSGLLMEVARLDARRANRKRAAATQALTRLFPLQREQAAALTVAAAGPGTRYTSYYEPVALINRHCSAQTKACLIEQLWRVAIADGTIDAYEEQLIRKLADLLYVAHADFILARHRVQNDADAAPHAGDDAH